MPAPLPQREENGDFIAFSQMGSMRSRCWLQRHIRLEVLNSQTLKLIRCDVRPGGRYRNQSAWLQQFGQLIRSIFALANHLNIARQLKRLHQAVRLSVYKQ